ncbi:MAG TPA: serine hydrolase domain-containing protein [Chitinophagaceae bacterium]|nr:serine hydrolase domain-containing protein [Chitinophagaceae bacterium]
MSAKLVANCLKCSLLAFFLLLLQPGWCQNPLSSLDQVLEQNRRDLGNNVVMLVWRGDTLAYKKELGDFNSKTVKPIASCSKWLTAALVMQFVDEGQLSLDDKITRWLPEFAKYGKNYITIRNCLSHMTGIEDEGGFLKKWMQRRKFTSLEEEVNSFAAREIRANPGTDFWYGEVGLNIAGRILEIISKRRFDVLIRQKLFVPLGMRRTSFSSTDGGPVNPSGGAQSTADDYIRFLGMLLNRGTFQGKRILSEKAVDEMMQLQTAPPVIKRYAPKVAEGYDYALGSWVLEKDPAGKPTALASPGLFGSWPVVDYCHGYAYIVFVKSLLSEGKAEANLQVKEALDRIYPSTCR